MNWQEITWVQWAQGIATVIVAILGFFIKRQVTQLHVTINSKMDSLLSLTREASKAEGKLEERAEQLARESERARGAAGVVVGTTPVTVVVPTKIPPGSITP